jgi:hypothetical protein
MATTTHHDINEAVSLEFNAKRIEKLIRKQQPKTELERTRGFYNFALGLAVVCEVIDAIATFTGIIHFSNSYINKEAFWLLFFIGGVIIYLGYEKHKTLDTYHSQRLDDGHVPNVTYVFLALFFVVSALATYNVTTPAVEFIAAKPILVDVDSVGIRHDSLLAADLLVIAKEVQTYDTAATSIFTAAEWKGRINKKSRTNYETALTNKSEATSKKTDVTLARNALKEVAINEAKAKNEKTIKAHKDWCANLGFYIALILIAFEIALLPSKKYTKDFEKKEVIEAKKKAEALLAQGQSVKGTDIHTPTNTPPLPSKNAKGKREKVFSSPNLAPTMQFKQGEPSTNSHEPKEGDILPPVGRGVHRALIEVNGKLDARTKGQLRTLKSAQGNDESERSVFIQTLIDKLP